jgi:hypothetical protein
MLGLTYQKRKAKPFMSQLSTAIAKTPTVWIPDKSVKNCYHCHQSFSMFIRKHHCRLCSRIHCHNCSNHRDIVPSFMEHLCSLKYESERRTCVRLCGPCATLVSKSKQNRKFIYVAMGLPIRLKALLKLKLLSKTWKESVDTLIGICRRPHYSIGHREYTNVERTFFRVHRRELFGHNQWKRHLLTLNLRPTHPLINTPCCQAFCRKGCQPTLACKDIVFLYRQRKRPDIQRVIFKFWERLPIATHKEMYFIWILYAENCPEYWPAIHKFCNKSLTLSTLVYIVSLREQLLDSLPSIWKESILLSHKTMCIFKRVSVLAMNSAPLESIKQVLAQFEEAFLLPWDTNWVCKKILLDKTQVFLSATRPIQIVVQARHRTTKCTADKYLLIKYADDVINDQVSMTIAYFLNANCDMNILRYPVLRVDPDFGILEIVPNAKHLHDIKYNLKTSLINYILEHNSEKTVKAIRKRLVNAVAASSLFAYTVGAGDRHLRNMMITTNGIFFHIDFGYILGKGPRSRSNAITLTQGIVEALGGTQSSSYLEFVERCKEKYLLARINADFFRRLTTLALNTDEDLIRSHFTDRFIPGELDGRAVTHLELAINSATKWSLTSSVLEIGHVVKLQAQEIFRFEF